ncbi:RNase HII [Albimonas donghaensis]|uniref:Ribonuclease HII n=1 Tax=Albimonas donghaensis TaxID=356660 RepID=A0A1H3E8R9_9RHOB|nr:ribonuclease HII [Albimonas donghaensis]SDX75055.1 RNase HII [Albimonas donghaensis]
MPPRKTGPKAPRPPLILPPAPDHAHETEALARLPAGALVCGVDEAGRGPWAGPVHAGAVVLNPDAIPQGLNDSKKLTARRREALAAELKACADWAVGVASVEEIDRLGLGRAADLAMIRAVEGLPRPPAFALIDGRRVPPGLPCPSGWLIKGDARSVSIAAASILAKTERDAEMDRLAVLHPEYGWEANRGYGAPAHIAALKLWGVTPHHRRSFRPIHNILVEESRPTD